MQIPLVNIVEFMLPYDGATMYKFSTHLFWIFYLYELCSLPIQNRKVLECWGTFKVKFQSGRLPTIKFDQENIAGGMVWFNYKFDYEESHQQRPECDMPLKATKDP